MRCAKMATNGKTMQLEQELRKYQDVGKFCGFEVQVFIDFLVTP